MKSGGEVLNGLGLFEVATSKQAIYSGQPSIPNFLSICQLGIDFFQNVPAGNVNIAGYIAFVQAWRGVRAFYAMGGGEVGKGGYIPAYISKEGAKGLAPVAPVPAVTDESGALVREGRPGKEGGGWVAFVPGNIQLATGNKIAIEGIPTIETNEGEVDFKGILFPYFREMLEPDVDFAYTIFISLFGLCLEDGEGPTSEAITVNRRGFRYLANSYAGRIIQHIYLGIKLAIDTGAGLVLVRDGSDYAGFFLKGEVIRVAVQNRVYSARSEKELSAELKALDIHNATIDELYEMLLDVEILGGFEEEITVEEMRRNPRMLREMIQKRSPEGIDKVRKVLSEKINLLKYSQTFWDITPGNLKRFLEAMVFKFPMKDEPMYIHIDVLCNRSSDILEYLSVFGVQAPSIYHGTKSLSIGKPNTDDPNLEIVDGKKKVPHMPFVKKGLAAAGQDWASVHRQKAFRYTPAEVKMSGKGFSSAKKRDGFVAEPDFTLFYSNLQKWVFTGQAAEMKGKRKAVGPAGENGEEDTEMTPPSKKTKYVFL
jgi:hypothetical protein